MNKFKIGDKVRYTVKFGEMDKWQDITIDGLPTNPWEKIYTGYDSTRPHLLGHFMEKDIELIKEETKVNKFKVGDKVSWSCSDQFGHLEITEEPQETRVAYQDHYQAHNDQYGFGLFKESELELVTPVGTPIVDSIWQWNADNEVRVKIVYVSPKGDVTFEYLVNHANNTIGDTVTYARGFDTFADAYSPYIEKPPEPLKLDLWVNIQKHDGKLSSYGLFKSEDESVARQNGNHVKTIQISYTDGE